MKKLQVFKVSIPGVKPAFILSKHGWADLGFLVRKEYFLDGAIITPITFLETIKYIFKGESREERSKIS